MKILGLSFGRNMKNSDLLVKHALMAAQANGAEIKFINVMNKKIGHCTGCGICSQNRDKGQQIRCIIKDDYLEVENEVLEADGIIVAAPVYSIAPTGQMKNFIDRFGAAHDRAFCLAEQNRRIEQGNVELLDERLFKDRYVAYISVGGAATQNWVSLGLPMFHLFGMSIMMKSVGQIDAYNMGRSGSPLLLRDLMDSVAKLGQHLAESIGQPYADVKWLGDEGVCPNCHNRMVTVLGKGTTIECPICGIEGNLSIDQGEIKISFPAAQVHRARGTFAGLEEHYLEIRSMPGHAIPKLQANKEFLDTEMLKYKELKSTY